METRNRRQRFVRDEPSYLDEASAVTVTALGAGYIISGLDFLPNLREALYHTRHAIGTAADMAKGGTEGMRAAQNLEEALILVEAARAKDEQAGKALDDYLGQRRELVGRIVQVYEGNENLGRQVERLQTQVQGAIKNVFEIGNSLKPDAMGPIDNLITKLYGQDPIVAREKSAQVKEFYDNVRKFYDASEKNEHTTAEFLSYLGTVKDETVAQNRRLNELLPGVEECVRGKYTVEDLLFKQRKEGEFTSETNRENQERLDQFKQGVDRTYNEVRQEAPITPYVESNLVDLVTNPMVLGAAVALAGYGFSRLLPGLITNPTTKVLAAPIVQPVKLVAKVVSGINTRIKKYKETSKLR